MHDHLLPTGTGELPEGPRRALARLTGSIAVLALCSSASAQGQGKFAADICRVPDLDHDGRRELAISDEERRTVWVVDPASGRVVRRITDAGTGGLALPAPDDLCGWSVESFSSIGGDFLVVSRGYPSHLSRRDQKLVDLATGRVVGAFRGGILQAPTLAGLHGVVLASEVRPGPRREATSWPWRRHAYYDYVLRLLPTDTLLPSSETVVRSAHRIGVCVPGKLDADESPDLLVVSGTSSGSEWAESVALHAYSGSDGSPIYERYLGVAQTRLGRRDLVATGDVDLDGAGDGVLVMRPPGGSELVLISGRSGKVLRRTEVHHGRRLAAIGDVDSDGVRDLALVDGELSCNGGRNTIWVHSTRTGECLYEVATPFEYLSSPEPSTAADDFGNRVCDLGDVDGDGVDDFAASANNPLTYDGEFVAVVSGRTGEFIKLILSKDYRYR